MKHNWEYKRLGDVGTIITGSTPKTTAEEYYNSSDYMFVKPGDISDNEITELHNTEAYVSELAFENSCRQLPEGSILVTCIGTIGKVGIISKKATCNQQINAIIPNECINRFIAYAILSIKSELNAKRNGPVVPIINKTQFSNFQIPVPPMEVQERIVAELDRINDLIDKSREMLSQLDALAQSLFYDTFGEYYDDKSQYFKPIKEIFETITDFVAAGSFASLRENVIYQEFPDFAQLVRTMDIKSNFTKGKFVYVDKHAFEFLWRVNLNSECIILPNIGVNCGEVYYLKPSYLRYKNNVLGPNAILIRSNRFNHHFLSFALKHDDFQKQLSKITSQVAQPKFNKTNLKELFVLLPPLALQEEFAERVEAIEAQKKRVEAEIAELQSLLNARMDYWFN